MIPKHRQPTHPGKILKEEFLDKLGMTQTECAKRMKVSSSSLSQLIHGDYGITVRTAIGLSKVFGGSIMFWMNLQVNYDIYNEIRRHK